MSAAAAHNPHKGRKCFGDISIGLAISNDCPFLVFNNRIVDKVSGSQVSTQMYAEVLSKACPLAAPPVIVLMFPRRSRTRSWVDVYLLLVSGVCPSTRVFSEVSSLWYECEHGPKRSSSCLHLLGSGRLLESHVIIPTTIKMRDKIVDKTPKIIFIWLSLETSLGVIAGILVIK